MTRAMIPIYLLLVSVVFTPLVHAQTGLSEETLELIGDMADRICDAVPLKGENTTLEGKTGGLEGKTGGLEGKTGGLEGKTEGDLGALLKRLEGVGVSGAADFKIRDYAGFAQDELLKAVETSVECRLVIWRDLEKRLFDPDLAEAQKCSLVGGATGSNMDRARLFNNRGVEFDRRGEPAKAIACFEMALSFDPGSITDLMNLHNVHLKWEKGDRDQAYYYIGRAIDVVKGAMRDIDLAMIRRFEANDKRQENFCKKWGRGGVCDAPEMSCAERNEFTGESYRTDLWRKRAGMHIADGKLDLARDDYTEIIDLYPSESCAYRSRVREAYNWRGAVQCELKAFDAAARDYARAAEMGRYDGDYAYELQGHLKVLGHYLGPIDGDLGSKSMEALADWARAGCQPFPE